MRVKINLIAGLFFVCAIGGCETAKGVQKDGRTTWRGLQDAKAWAAKVQTWSEEYLW